jgi:hypothetical protein
MLRFFLDDLNQHTKSGREEKGMWGRRSAQNKQIFKKIYLRSNAILQYIMYIGGNERSKFEISFGRYLCTLMSTF